ncbi:thiamine pyrophosphate-dependent enzyme [Parapusillimonas granuli]|uniref:Aldehyde dehydrogenase n=1 Tax=Parapusillimonas granuli TaxID=380911 RepID=A0A853G1S1_9BURK|nr:thiamine pyrophosphate-dependent enzyme [Parapusillimonas granuli]MBB5216997.1 thiamine pyrophosphate-dependent acetolactate synthase large subunit-like protein [Parapusillimonas granuli]MEB2400673.1 thiamine pyrophosphate-dependent enzyme [Alcaligenaceae bacterium]NYT50239.1 aldehyde dehydrogenase [Parapusillimonas granuli]
MNERHNSYTLNRREIVKQLLKGRDDMPVVTGLSSASYDSVAARGADHPLNFNLHGALGGAAMVGLGLALAQPEKRVMVLMGDGDVLCGLGSLATYAISGATNLSLAIFDNGIYGETGNQLTATAKCVELGDIAAGCGMPVARTVDKEDQVDAAVHDLLNAKGPVVINFKVSPAHPGHLAKTRDGVWMKLRFRNAFLGQP